MGEMIDEAILRFESNGTAFVWHDTPPRHNGSGCHVEDFGTQSSRKDRSRRVRERVPFGAGGDKSSSRQFILARRRSKCSVDSAPFLGDAGASKILFSPCNGL